MNQPAGITVAGGDGTLFHLLCRLGPPRPPVTLVPNGRGNALARDIGMGREACVDAVRVRASLASGRILSCWSFSSIGLGYPAEVTRRAARIRFLKRLSYAGAAVFTVPRWAGYEISLDGEPPRRGRLRGVLLNSTRYTGGFEALPQASSAGGRVECLELAAGYVAQLAHNLSVMTGCHCYAPVRLSRVARARVTLAEPSRLMVDGEMLEAVDHLEVVPRALRVRVAHPARG